MAAEAANAQSQAAHVPAGRPSPMPTMPTLQVTARVTVRGQPPRAEVVGKLQVACVEVLVAALGWRAFRWAGQGLGGV